MTLGDLIITSASTERQKRSQNLVPVLVMISGHALVFSKKIITRVLRPGASAPVVVKKISLPDTTFLEFWARLRLCFWARFDL